MSFYKNGASQNLQIGPLFAVADGSLVTGATAVKVIIDNGSATTGSGTLTYKDKGYYLYAPTQAETNGEVITYIIDSTGSNYAGTTLNTTPAVLATAASVTAVPAAVVDLATSGHTTAGTFGEAIAGSYAFGAPPSATTIAAAVWNALLATYATANTFGAAVGSILGFGAPPSVPTANQNAAALLDLTDGVESGWTLRQWLRVAGSALFGKSSGLSSTTATYRDVPDTKDRIVATVDADGNRSDITYDKT